MDSTRRKNVGGGGGDPKEKMRTHMMFMTSAEKETKKKVRRKIGTKLDWKLHLLHVVFCKTNLYLI